MISDAELRRMVWRGLGVHERVRVLAAHPNADVRPEAVRAAGSRLEAWRAATTRGDEGRWARRLTWSGVTEAELRRAVSASAPRDLELPDWAGSLREMLAAMESVAPGSGTAGARATSRHPFQAATTLLAREASRAWSNEAPDRDDLFTAEAVVSAERGLARVLSDRTSLTLLTAFRDGRRETSHGDDVGHGDDARHRRFVARLASGGWRELLVDHPVLARQVGVAMYGWVRAMIDLGARLRHDRPVLESLEWGPGPLLPIRDVEMNRGDLHRGGVGTMILVAGDGRRVVYKPRSLTAEAGWADLVTLMRTEGLDLAAAGVQEGDGYGWMEHVEHRRVQNDEEMRTFYRRAGHLAAVAYALGSVDAHVENVVASGPWPVPVDLETVLQPTLRDDAGGPASVLRAGLLPRWDPIGDGPPVDLSALGCLVEQRVDYPERTWSGVGTDAIEVVERPAIVRPAENVPRRPAPDLRDVAADLDEGFDEACVILERHARAMEGSDSWVEVFRRCEIRCVLRSSHAYQRVLDRGVRPDLLRDGVEWSIVADRMNLARLDRSERPAAWSVVDRELTALMDGTIPRFTALADSHEVRDADSDIEAATFRSSGLQAGNAILAGLSAEDRRRQRDLLRRSIRAWGMVRDGGTDMDRYLAASILPLRSRSPERVP